MTDILLDFDDTIIDTRKNAHTALGELYEHFDLGSRFDCFESFSEPYWRRNHEVWAAYARGEMTKEELIIERFRYPLSLVGLGTEEMALACNDFFLDACAAKGELVEGARDLLDYLRSRGYRIHMLSNGFAEVQHKKMRSAGVEEYFDKVILSEDVGVNKPDPAIYAYALREAGCSAADCIMIGDNFDTDIRGAIAAGIAQIYFNPEGKPAPVTPTYEVRRLEEIKSIL
jgi:putative hydrolase of the HAD superfamily